MTAITITKPCANCGTEHSNRNAFCSNYCSELTDFIRKARRWLRDQDKMNDPNYEQIFAVRLAKIFAYILNPNATWNHNIPIAIRRAVIERDNGICQICSDPGTEVDHIDGPESTMENLQLLCHNCNMAKALARMRTIDDIGKQKLISAFVIFDLSPRINDTIPSQLSDDEQNWANVWRKWPAIQSSPMYVQLETLGSFKDVNNAAKRGTAKSRQ